MTRLTMDLGPANDLFRRNYQTYCDDGLRDFCNLFWPCEFNSRAGKCVNVREGHSKGHQNEKGKLIGSGQYQSSFSFESHLQFWRNSIIADIEKTQKGTAEDIRQRPTVSEKDLVAISHRQTVQRFFYKLKGPRQFISHSACFCCLRNMPEHPLQCGHVLCTSCIKTYSDLDRHLFEGDRHVDGISGFERKPWESDNQAKKHFIQLDRCPLHRENRFGQPWFIKLKPEFAGVRILALDG